MLLIPAILHIEAALFLLDVVFNPGGERAALEGGRQSQISAFNSAHSERLHQGRLHCCLIHARVRDSEWEWEGQMNGTGREGTDRMGHNAFAAALKNCTAAVVMSDTETEVSQEYGAETEPV